MTWFDLLLVGFLFTFVWGGFKSGLIMAIGGIVGLLFGSVLATRLYVPFSGWVAQFVGHNETTAKIVAFIVLFVFISRIIALVFWIINRMFHFIAIIPGLKLINKFGGGIIGFLEGSLFLGLVLQFAGRLPIDVNLTNAINGSTIAPYLLGVSGWLVAFFPVALKQSQTVIDRLLPTK